MKKADKSPARKRPGRGALLIIGLLFFTSGLIRIADGTGHALAREVEAFASSSAEASDVNDASDPAMCATEDGITEALTSVRERTSALELREKQIEQRMASLQRAEQKIEDDLAALVAAEEALSATISLADGAAEKDISSLIAVYERMKPKDVAAVFDAMDPSFAAGFLARMRPDAAASVMAGLSPTKAYSVSILLAGRNVDVPTE